MQVVEIDPKNRNERDVLSTERQELRIAGIRELEKSLMPFTEKIDELYKKEAEFKDQAKSLLKTLRSNYSIIKVRTTGGK